MNLSRIISDPPVVLYDDPAADSAEGFSARVEGLLNKGWHLQGGPALTFNPARNAVIGVHTIAGFLRGPYRDFIPTGQLPSLPRHQDEVDPPSFSTLYRLLVGPDDRDFCAFIERKLNEGWHKPKDSVAATFDTNLNRVLVAHVITREIDGPYRSFQPLAKFSSDAPR